MIETITYKVVNNFVKNEIIEKEDSEVFGYGLHILLSSLLGWVIVLIIGKCLGIVEECIFYMLSYSSLRAVAGGYHANKESLCIIYYCILFILTDLACLFFGDIIIQITNYILSGSMITLILFAPVSPKETSYTNRKRRKAKVRSIAVAGLITLMVLWAKDRHVSYSMYGMMGMAGCCLLIIAGYIKQVYTKG